MEFHVFFFFWVFSLSFVFMIHPVLLHFDPTSILICAPFKLQLHDAAKIPNKLKIVNIHNQHRFYHRFCLFSFNLGFFFQNEKFVFFSLKIQNQYWNILCMCVYDFYFISRVFTYPIPIILFSFSIVIVFLFSEAKHCFNKFGFNPHLEVTHRKWLFGRCHWK